MTKLKVTDISYSYREGANLKHVLQNISVDFEAGYLYAILGYSGSGKTTLLSILAGLNEQSSGVIELDGENISAGDLVGYRRNKVSMVFQDFKLIEYQTAHQNIITAFRITNNDVPTDMVNVAYNLLNFVGISQSRAVLKINNLSGGEKQRVAIARCLAQDGDIIFADEPTGNLDSEAEGEIIKLLKVLATEYNKCIVVATHSDQVAKAADMTFKLEIGKLAKV